MSQTIRDMERQALQLSREDRAHLADRLLSSLALDPSVEDAWAIEVDRRITEFESGSVLDVPVEDALARARAAIR
ncbi:addiction module protein [uncultured Thiodictyon sp.]|jgi:putative addiction module component (TIGR02574 family)|uniref:addiction module protein n=1 Tax=uncultured Thiodictyon sp. TaxID=1846217 RepID=UPI0025F5C837|nr:addiction module protein [uncultured Thiodictyon sp.]